ncbi:MAG: CvpA family protein [Bacteroidaceae bacterium]|nr:CvpA family protein [Bacteroidaceae bacterium]
MLELICLAVLLYGAWRGWRNGFITEVISFTGIFLGFYVAYELYRHSHVNLLSLVLIWVAIPLLLNAVAWLVTKTLDKVLVVGSVNKLLGAAAGFLKYAFVLGCIIWVLDYVREVKTRVEQNPVVKTLEAVPNYLFPDVIKEVENGGKK